MKYYLLTLLMAIILTACSEPHNQKLNDINSYLNEHPTQPLDVRPALDSIDYNSLSERDQIFHNLLSIKISDLNFENHTSDTLINKILNYTDKHPDVSFRCEAIYYGGRIHCELGDLPTALKYYQQALDNVKTISDSVIMLGKIYAQMGGLLDRLRLFDEAIPLFESVIEQDIVRGDTINEVNDLLYLGQIYLRKDEPEKAIQYFSKVLEKKSPLSPQIRAKCKMLLASAYKSLNNDTALVLIKEALDSIDSYTRWNALAHACWIYKKFGSKDTAYMYAKELIHGESDVFRETGYRIAISEEFKDYVPDDSLRKYVKDYHDILRNDFNSNQRNLTLMQHSMYNYTIHKLARMDSEKENQTLINWIWGISVVFLATCFLFSLRLLHNKKTIITLQTSLGNVNKVQSSMDIKPVESTNEENKSDVSPKVTVKSLREKLMVEIRTIAEKNDTAELDSHIATSAVYTQLMESIRHKKIIDNNTELWNELEGTVLNCSPEFKNRLTLLTNGLITNEEYQTALLIKCNIKQVDISILLGRTSNSIASRKKSISKKIYGEKLIPSLIDQIIKNL